MAEYIDKEAFLAKETKQYCSDCERRKGIKNGKRKIIYEIGEAPCRSCGINDILDDIDRFPTSDDIKPVVRGKWRLGGYGQVSDAAVKWYDQFLQGGFFYCSACKERSAVKTKFCPNCGADMREEN